MNPVTEYRIIYRNLFSGDDFHFEVVPGKRKYKASTRQLINEAWQDAKLNPDLDIFNGQIISLHSIFMKNDTRTGRNALFLKVQATDYKSFYGTNVCNPNRLPKTELANALSVCAVVETSEGTVFTGRRNEKLAETSGVWHVPGGTFNAVQNPLDIMLKELSEELNIAPEDIQYSICLGFGENLLMKKPEFLCYYHLKLSEQELIAKMEFASDKDEHTEYAFVPMEELENFISIHPFAPIGKAAVELYLDYISSN